MQLDRPEGWMGRQIGKTDLTKKAVIDSFPTRHSDPAPLLARLTRPPATTLRRLKGGVAGTRRSVAAVTGPEMCSILPPQASPALVINREFSNRRVHDEESVKKRWRTQLYEQQPPIEGDRVDRTKVLHNLLPTQRDDDESPALFLWGPPHESVLDFIHQSTKNSRRSLTELGNVSSEKDEAARVRRAVSNVLATAPSNLMKKHRSPRSPHSQWNVTEGDISSRKGRGLTSPRTGNVLRLFDAIPSPRSRVTSRSEERIQQFIAELRTDPALWAAFQHEVGQIQQRYQLKRDTSDKIRVNKELARTPRSFEEHELRKKQAAERMERTRHQREQILHSKDKQLLAKREKYLRRVNPSQFLPASELELSVRDRRRKIWLHVASFAIVSHRWHQELVQSKDSKALAKLRNIAAATIQQFWRKWKRQHTSQQTVIIYWWLRKCLWKTLLRLRCRRKAREATLLRQFILDHCTVSHARRNFYRVMVQWRNKVIRAQKASRSFVVCNRSRLLALSIWFDKIDHERLRMFRQVNNEERRLAGRKDSASNNFGSGRSRTSSAVILGGMDEKRASMQLLISPIELQHLQQISVQCVKIPKSIKWQLLTEFLAESRKELLQKQRVYREKIQCAVHTREVKLEEARAIVQGSYSWDKTADANISHTRSMNKAIQPPCFSLFSDLNAAQKMDGLVRRGVQLTLDADPELRALIARQQELRLQPPHIPSRRSSVSFSGTAALTPTGLATLSPPRRQSILKKPA